MSSPPDREKRFQAIYAQLRPELLRFVRRREPEPGVAEDVVADALLVLWRRLDEAPHDLDGLRAWTYGITRNMLLNAKRGRGRRRALEVRLAGVGVPPHESSHDGIDGAVHRVDLARAWTRLSSAQQETLALTVMDGLDSVQAAAVLDISPVAFRLRLSRARRALQLHLDHQPRAIPAVAGPTLRSTS